MITADLIKTENMSSTQLEIFQNFKDKTPFPVIEFAIALEIRLFTTEDLLKTQLGYLQKTKQFKIYVNLKQNTSKIHKIIVYFLNKILDEREALEKILTSKNDRLFLIKTNAFN